LNALIAVMNQPSLRATPPNSHVQRLNRELGTHVFGNRPTDATATKRIENNRYEDKCISQPHIRQICNP
jgi:hypothetical protein